MIACTKCHGCLAWPPITHSDGDRRDLRDRALIAVLINTYARITVALKSGSRFRPPLLALSFGHILCN
jgi:hypothetical protein